jgi:CubicO group peptidase (beta-lactamase class C family)
MSSQFLSRNFTLRRFLVRPTAVLILILTPFVLGGLSQSARPPVRANAPPTAISRDEIFPGRKWDRAASPESVGYSSQRLEAVLPHVRQLDTSALMVIVHGRLLLDYGDTSAVSYIASVRKSILAMLYGSYVASGRIRLSKTLRELRLTDRGGLLPQEREATIADLLSARSGIYHLASNEGDNSADAPPRGSQKHGAYFLYNNWDFNALGTIFEQETGRNIYDALETDLARPIHMQDFKRELQKKSGDLSQSIHPAYHIYLSTRDMARIGYLMLRDGNWAGQQLVPHDWIQKITTPVTHSNEMNPANLRNGRFGYGYLWWVWDGPKARGPYEQAYTGIGLYGQYITVLPKLDMVIAHKVEAPGKLNVSQSQYFRIVDEIIGARLSTVPLK